MHNCNSFTIRRGEACISASTMFWWRDITWEGNMKVAILAALTTLAMFLSIDAYAHSGGTDSNGCHTNHQTGEYHCH